MRRKISKPAEPKHGPNQRAKQLNLIAAHGANTDDLCIEEALYVRGIYWTLRRYWRHEICAYQAQAEQRLWQVRYLQGGWKK